MIRKKNNASLKITKIRDDSCFKIYAIFKCLKDDCCHSWKSFHGWETFSEYSESCGACGTITSATGVTHTAAPISVDVFVCQKCNKATHALSVPITVGDGNVNPTANCPECGDKLEKSGEQQRIGKLVAFNCDSEKCRKEWASPYFGKKYTQRCSKCHNKGHMVGLKLFEDKEGGGGRKGFGFSRGIHDIEGCDMCQELLGRGIRKSCLRLNAVRIHEGITERGLIETSIHSFQVGPPPIPKGVSASGPFRPRNDNNQSYQTERLDDSKSKKDVDKVTESLGNLGINPLRDSNQIRNAGPSRPSGSKTGKENAGGGTLESPLKSRRSTWQKRNKSKKSSTAKDPDKSPSKSQSNKRNDFKENGSGDSPGCKVVYAYSKPTNKTN